MSEVNESKPMRGLFVIQIYHKQGGVSTIPRTKIVRRKEND